MDIEAKERLRHIARRLVDASYVKACDPAASDEEFRKSVDALVNHLTNVRRRSLEAYREEQPV
jgi:hypothetical protein